MEPDQVHVRAGTMLRGLEQVLHAVETRLPRQVIGDVADLDRYDRVHHDTSIVHGVTAARLDLGALPDPDAASDPPTPDALTKPFAEHHVLTASRSRPKLADDRRPRRTAKRPLSTPV